MSVFIRNIVDCKAAAAMSAYVAQEEDIYTKDGTTDYRHKPAVKSKTGTWKACPYILGLSPFFLVCLVCAHGHMLSAKFYPSIFHNWVC